MKTRIYLLTTVLVTLLTACKSNSDNRENKNIVIEPSNLEIAQYDDIIDSVKYIKLALNPEHPIARISKIAFHDSLIYILDDKSNKLFVYNQKGNFHFLISAQGMGPDEYTGIQDFTINKEASTIELIDVSARKIICYNIHNGEFIQTIPLTDFAFYLLAINKDEYLFFDNNKEFFSINMRSSQKDKLKKFTDTYPFSRNNIQYLYKKGDDGTIGVFSVEDNSIYYLQKGELKCQYTFSFKDYQTSADFPGYDRDQPKELENNGIDILMIKDMPNWIYIKYGTNKDHTVHAFLYNKNTQKHFMMDGVAHFPGFILTEPVPQEVMENCLITTSNNIPIDAYKTQLNILPDTPENESFKKTINSVSSDDNPLLQIIYFKK